MFTLISMIVKKKCKSISMKLGGMMGNGSRKNPLNFGADPD